MTTVSATDQARLAQAWAENTAPGQIRACGTSAALCDWIVRNRYSLGDLERGSPSARGALQVVINNRFQEIG